MNCSDCQQSSVLKEVWGCEKPSQYAALAIDKLEYHTCPVHFLTSEITNWYREYNALEKGWIQPDKLNEKQCRWFEAAEIYSHYRASFEAKSKPKKSLPKTNIKKVSK